MLSESVILLGQDIYKTIPNQININAVPTASELEYVGAEDFDRTMVMSIFPKVVDESDGMDFTELLEIDYDWICRCLRIKSYGPYITTNRIYCNDCNDVHKGEFQVDLRTVGLTPLPSNCSTTVKISSEDFIYCKDDFELRLLTMKDRLVQQQDTLFDRKDGTRDGAFANICYMVKRIGTDDTVTPIDVRNYIKSKMESIDYEILKTEVSERTNFGLHVMGSVECPVCHGNDAYFIALRQDKFFRPSMGDIKQYKLAVRSGEWEGLSGDPSRYVRGDNR